MRILKSASLVGFFLAMILVTSTPIFAQRVTLSDQIESYEKNFPKEKLYLTFDKPYYSVGDTVWFKSFLLNENLGPTSITDKIYVELFNDSSKLVDQRVIALNNGLGYGNMPIDTKLKEGSYTIRAYSNWQQNFGEDYFFQKSFYLGKADPKTWLLTTVQQLKTDGLKRTLNLKVKITNLKNEPAGLKDLEISFLNDEKRLMRSDLQTTLDGLIETNIILPEGKTTGNYQFYILDKKDKSRKLMVPIKLEDASGLDLQFMPEGGLLVNDIYSKIAFKAIGTDGLAKNITGKIVDQQNKTLTTFAAVHNGMGSFYLLPQTGEIYTAIISTNNGEQKFPLPVAKTSGTTLRIEYLSQPDSMFVYLKASASKSLDGYQLVAQSAGKIIVAIPINLKSGFVNLKLPKFIFSNQIVHFTLFSPEQQPLNERQILIKGNEYINLAVETTKSTYLPKDSVSLTINATNEDGFPLSGTFAISVTDDGQVKQQQNEDYIASYFLLQSNLKGNIEDARWYFKNNELQTNLALDHLLLTQGWVGYSWDSMLDKNAFPKFVPEKDNLIHGKLTGLFNKPVEGIKLMLLSLGKYIFTADTLSNIKGEFTFKNLPTLDTTAYIIKIRKPKGTTSNATIYIDEFNPPASISLQKPITPWFFNSDSTLLNYFKTAEKRVKQAEKAMQLANSQLLKEVEIFAPKRDLLTNETWDAHLFKRVTEEELKKNPRKNAYRLLQETIEGFTISKYWQTCGTGTTPHPNDNYVVGTRLVSWIRVDKIVTDYEEVHELINRLNAEDLKLIEFYKGCSTYYLDITTRSGNGPWSSKPAGVYVYRPLPIQVPKDFYSPKYTVSNNSSLPDLRSTIFWDANVVTDENGKAQLSFYAADKAATYTIKIEGTDLMGRFGYQKASIKIINKTESK
jgi:hypothetical protein